MNLNNRSFKVKRLAENQYLYNGDLICNDNLNINLKGTLTVRGRISVKGMLISDCNIWAEKEVYVGRSILVMGDLHAEESIHAGDRIVVDGSASSRKDIWAGKGFEAKFVSAFGVHTGGMTEDIDKQEERGMTMEEYKKEIRAIKDEEGKNMQGGADDTHDGITVRQVLDCVVGSIEIFIKPSGRRTYYEGAAGDAPESLMNAIVQEMNAKIIDDGPVFCIWVKNNEVWDIMVDKTPEMKICPDLADEWYGNFLKYPEWIEYTKEEIQKDPECRIFGKDTTEDKDEPCREDDSADVISGEKVELDLLQELLVEDEEAREAAKISVSEETEAYLEGLRQEKIRQEADLIQPSNHPGRVTRAIDAEEDGERLR